MHRGRHLAGVYDEAAAAIRKIESELVTVLTSVTTRHSALEEVASSVRVLENASSEQDWMRLLPEGLDVSVFLPSNNLLYSYVLFALMPSGWDARIRMRPSSRVKDTYRDLHELLASAGGGRLTLLDETQRDFVDRAKSSDLVIFTGNPDNGRAIGRVLPHQSVLVGLGSGPNPVVVGPSAELQRAVQDAVEARLYNGGQDCLCPDVVFVHRTRVEEFEERLVAQLENVPVDTGDEYGLVNSPLIYPDAYAAATEWIEQQRPYVRWQASLVDLPNFLPMTVVLSPSVSSALFTELFAPVFHLVPYDDPAELLRWAHSPANLAHGFYFSVYGEPALDDPLIGTAVNVGARTAFDAEDGNTPFGGYGPRASWVSTGGHVRGTPVLASREAATHARRA